MFYYARRGKGLKQIQQKTITDYTEITNQSIQGVTGPHRQNDRDDRPCSEDQFL